MAHKTETVVESSSNFTFRKLLRPDSIRLLNLSPLEVSDSLQANLSEHTLDDCPDFEAVSYCWGEPVFSSTIYLDGLHFDITGNLCSALRHFRLKSSSRRLWVDAISIDQKDVEEKSVQVWMMGKIFARASCALVWLGEGNEATDTAMRNVQAYFRELKERQWAVPSKQLPSFHELHDWNESNLSSLIREFEVLRLHPLFVPDWWKRLWVVQEFAVAKSVLMVSGSQELDWSVICSAIRIYFSAIRELKREPPALDFIIPVRSILAIINTRRAYQGSLENNCLHVVTRSAVAWILRFQHCGDDRDRAFAIMGLIGLGLSQEVASTFRPDYTLTVEQVYKRFTIEHVLSQAAVLSFIPEFVLRRIGLANHVYPHIPTCLEELQDQNYLPSWSMDYRPCALDYGAREIFEALFGGNSECRETASPQLTVGQSDCEMSLQGSQRYIVSHTFDMKYPDHGGLDFVRRFIMELKEQCFHSRSIAATDAAFEGMLGNILSRLVNGSSLCFPVNSQTCWATFQEYILNEDSELYRNNPELHAQLQMPSEGKKWAWTPAAQRLTDGDKSLSGRRRLAWLCCRVFHELFRAGDFFTTLDGLIGIAPRHVSGFIENGAQIFAFAGANTYPFVLMPWTPASGTVNKNYYSLVGYAYLHGVQWYEDVWLPIEEGHGWNTISII